MEHEWFPWVLLFSFFLAPSGQPASKDKDPTSETGFDRTYTACGNIFRKKKRGRLACREHSGQFHIKPHGCGCAKG